MPPRLLQRVSNGTFGRFFVAIRAESKVIHRPLSKSMGFRARSDGNGISWEVDHVIGENYIFSTIDRINTERQRLLTNCAKSMPKRWPATAGDRAA
jgi:hypothetical protein